MVLPASPLHVERRCKGMQWRGTRCQQQQSPKHPPLSIACAGSSPPALPHVPPLWVLSSPLRSSETKDDCE